MPLRFMQSLPAPLLGLALLLPALVPLAGCGGGGSNPPVNFSDYTITIRDAQDVDRVTVFQQSGSQFDQVYTQQFFSQNPIVIHLQLLTDQAYRIEAEYIDPSTGLASTSYQDVVVNPDGSTDYLGSPLSRSRQEMRQVDFSLGQMRKTNSPAVSSATVSH